MSLQGSESTLASVIGSPTIGVWHSDMYSQWLSKIVPEDTPCGQLFKKFWGTSMEEEEHVWREAQLTESRLRGKDQDGDGGGEITDVDDDIIPGCYLLTFDIDGIAYRDIWIRADYMRVYDRIEKHYKSCGAPTGMAPCVVLTGQPGIGKSVWILYALRRRLAEKKPVIWYQDKIYLFVEEGVFVCPPDFSPSNFKIFVWTLVDSDENKEGIPPSLVKHHTRLFVVYATSPKKERWSRLHKTVREIRVIMNPWTRKEILRTAMTTLPQTPLSRINEIFDELGPIPRLCINYLSEPEKLIDYKRELHDAILNVTIEQLETLTRDASSLTMSGVSHKLFLIYREKREVMDTSNVLVAPITGAVQKKLAFRFHTLQKEEQIRLYKYFAKVPDSRAVAGVFFESIFQQRLQEGITLKLVRMVKLDPDRQGKDSDKAMPQWHSSHLPFTHQILEKRRVEELGNSIEVNIAPSQILEFAGSGPSPVESGTFYVPVANNQEVLDSFFLLDDGRLIIFQFTISVNHSVKPGLIEFLKLPGVPTMDKWMFVFVIPPMMTVKCPQPWLVQMRQLKLYYTVVDI